MTVLYNGEVATARFLGLLRLLFRWKGSIYKLLWVEFLVYFSLYFILMVIYRFVLPDHHQRIFEELANYCEDYSQNIPVTFVLAFYVTLVVTRWQEQFNAIPQPSRLGLFVTASVPGMEDRSRLVRRNIMRYVCLGYVLTMMSISSAVKKRFTTMSHVAAAGLMLESEREIIEGLRVPFNKYYVPFVWAANLVVKARKQGLIKNDFCVQMLIDEIVAFRGKCQTLFNYDWINIPLVYTQVAAITTYVYFLACLVGRQKLLQNPSGNARQGDLILIVPVFTMLQFIFYQGWLKVAEELMNPFGEDDDDFDINAYIDKNIHMSYLIVDEMHNEVPELIKDQYWDDKEFLIPYTEAANHYRKDALLSSADYIEVPEEKQQFVTFSEDANERGVGEKRSSVFDHLARSSRNSLQQLQQQNNSAHRSQVDMGNDATQLRIADIESRTVKKKHSFSHDASKQDPV